MSNQLERCETCGKALPDGNDCQCYPAHLLAELEALRGAAGTDIPALHPDTEHVCISEALTERDAERQRADAAESKVAFAAKVAGEALDVIKCFHKNQDTISPDSLIGDELREVAALAAPASSATDDVYTDGVTWACPKCHSENMTCECEGVHISETTPSSSSNRCIEVLCQDCHWSGEFPASDTLDNHNGDKK